MIRVKTSRESKLEQFKNELEASMQNRLATAGAFLEKEMVEKIDAGLSPALLPVTENAKKSSLPLVDTGELHDQISCSTPLSDRDSVEVGIFGSRAQIAKYHEFGAPGAHIPERSFMRSAFNENRKRIKKIVSGK